MRYKFISLLTSFILMTSMSAHSAQMPKAGYFDSRVKSVTYNPKQVIQMTGHYGYSTHIEFSPFETIQNIAMGDSEAWDIAPTGNHIFLKPKAEKASTNMTIITNKRVYNFDLNAKNPLGKRYIQSKNMDYQINFIYPDEEAQKQKNQQEALKLTQALHHDTTPIPINWNYWSKGTAQINPIKVFDDGRFTYITFTQQGNIPAIYMLDDDNQESLLNSHINPNDPHTLIIQKITKRMILRHGNGIVLLVNHAYNPHNLNRYKHDTINPIINRVIKEKN